MSATETRGDDRRLAKTRTPGIYKRGDHYVAVFRDHTGRQRKRVAPTLSAARAAKDEGRADVNRGEFLAVSRVTFAEYAPRWVGSYTGRTRRGIGPRTLSMYRDDLGLDADGNPTGGGAVAFFGRLPLAQVGPAELRQYAAKLSRQGLARSSVRRKLAPVKALLATAHEERLIRFNPCAGARIVAPANQDEEAVERVKALTPTELAAVLDKVPDEWRLFVMFLAETGLRIGEAVECRWSDLDRADRRLTVARQYHRGKVAQPKGRKTRRIRISTKLDAMLWEHRKQSKGRDDGLIFTGPLGARVDAKNLAARMLKPACRSAGVGDWPTWHTFRHTAASMLFRNGWNAPQVSRHLGHADAGFTLRTYVHLLDDDLPEPDVLDALDRGYTGATQPAQIGRNPMGVGSAPIPLPVRDRATGPSQAETPGAGYESAALTS